MSKFTIHVPFTQHDEYRVEADSVEEAVEIARYDPNTPMDTDIDECIEYDWDSATVFDEKGERYDSFGKKQ